MTTIQSQTSQTTLPWMGIHHLALVTHDLDETIHFYHHILGMEVSDIIPSHQGRGRHCIILVKPGDDNVLGLHFFERTTVKAPAQPATLADSASEGNRFLHLALRLPDGTNANLLRDCLRTHGVEITEIPELCSFVFSDNNAILLEVTWPQS
jgi:catechol 2,3-dioxygenase-like lactoylglutathione lyase family enzyme